MASARKALADALGVALPPLGPEPAEPRLDEPVRLFVSWHEGPRLVGCIGTLEASLPLRDAVRRYAVEAGLHDPRTPTPAPEDLPRMRCEISLLTAPAPMPEQGLGSIIAALVPGRDGLVLRDGERRAVFLPVVWESLPEPAAFVAALCRKARIDVEQRGAQVRAERFFAERFEEAEPHEAVDG